LTRERQELTARLEEAKSRAREPEAASLRSARDAAASHNSPSVSPLARIQQTTASNAAFVLPFPRSGVKRPFSTSVL
jgi:hypothetical protein